MKMKWEVDAATTVEFKIGVFGGKRILVNGTRLDIERSLRKKAEIPFALPDGRAATVQILKSYVGYPDILLRVDGHMIVASEKKPIKCSSCSAVAKPYDRFCGACGHAMPTAEDYLHKKHVRNASGAMKILAVLFVLSGIAMFFVTKMQSEEALGKLQSMDPEAVLSTPINGEIYTVEALTNQLLWEPWGVLIINVILAATMGVLALWSKRAPLAAILIATATYVVVIVGNAIADPITLTQGMIMKIIVIAFLLKGIKSALTLRSAYA
ncbi:zinc ribbon domain-containing protein [Noviherbaspirillum massiliense]|uniref:zinc ribbon domain-containing protein n=1 Tax=Noviherbaspirillum massiliense TaxID=1465823 RepID=UPI00031931B8|nr:zinc ribbon domain-containing protein [Noviherbaspirillum massiliense]